MCIRQKNLLTHRSSSSSSSGSGYSYIHHKAVAYRYVPSSYHSFSQPPQLPELYNNICCIYGVCVEPMCLCRMREGPFAFSVFSFSNDQGERNNVSAHTQWKWETKEFGVSPYTRIITIPYSRRTVRRFGDGASSSFTFFLLFRPSATMLSVLLIVTAAVRYMFR